MNRITEFRPIALLCVLAWTLSFGPNRACADQTNEIRIPAFAVLSIHVPPQPPCGYYWSLTSSGNVTVVPEFASDQAGLFINCKAEYDFEGGTVIITLRDKPPCPDGTNVLVYRLIADSDAKNTAANSQTHSQGDPVNPFTGELVMGEAPDLYLGGPMPLMFTRYYASRLRRDSLIHSSLGANWSHNFDFSLVRVSNVINVVTWRGRIARFRKTGANWNLMADFSTPFQLVESGTNYLFGDPRMNLVYTFNSEGELTAVDDGRGNTHTLTYDSSRLLRSISDGLGRRLTLEYDPFLLMLTDVSDGTRDVRVSAGNEFFGLDSVADPASSTFYKYDLDGDGFSYSQLQNVTHLGNVQENVSSSYNANGQVLGQIINPFAFQNATTNAFNYSGNITTITNPFGGIRVFTHDSAGRLLAETDEAGKTEFFAYDNTGRRVAITNRMGEVTRIAYHLPSGKPASITRADGKSISFEYSSRLFNGITLYDLDKITFPDGKTEIFTRDHSGNVVAQTDPSGRTTSISYNNHGQPLSETNSAGGVTFYSYTPDATLASMCDPASNLTAFGYDSLHRLTSVTNADGTVASWQYSGEDRITAVQDPSGALRKFSYGPRHNYLGSFTDGQTNLWKIDYANSGDSFYSVTDPAAGVFGYLYDGLQRVRAIADNRRGGGCEMDFTFDSRGRTVAVTDFDGNTNKMGYDDAGRQISSTDALGNETRFRRDSLGRITEISSPLTNMMHLDYDDLGRPTKVSAPDGTSIRFGYDEAGRLLHSGAGYAAADYGRGALGLLDAILDSNGQLWSSPRDAAGRVSSRTDPLGRTMAISFDNRNRPRTFTFPGGLGGVTNIYDGVGRLTRARYSDGTDLQFEYDRNGNLTSGNAITLAYDNRGLMTNANGIAITRDAAGRIETLTFAPGKTVAYEYNNRDLVTSIWDWLGGTTRFGYDAAGRMTNCFRPNGVNGAYTYDAEGRVATIQEGSMIALAFSRDQNGRVTRMDRTAPVAALPPAAANFTFDAASQVNGFQYDALGRVLRDATRSYQWDLASCLLTYTNGGSAVHFTYDALGSRLTRTNGATNREYVWNYAFDLPSISIEKQDGADRRYYVHAPDGSLLYSVDANTGARQFYHYDETGNTLALTDDAGAVVAAYAWGPYGEAAGASGTVDNNFTWQGRWGVMAEPGTGLFYQRARFYDSASARFLTRDPFQSMDPRRINPYQFAAGNPLRFVDPNGTSDRFATWCRWQLAGGDLASLEQMAFEELLIAAYGQFAPLVEGRLNSTLARLRLDETWKSSGGTQIDPPAPVASSQAAYGTLHSYLDTSESLKAVRNGPPPPVLPEKVQPSPGVLHVTRQTFTRVTREQQRQLSESADSWGIFAPLVAPLVALGTDGAFFGIDKVEFEGRVMAGGNLNYYTQGQVWATYGASESEMFASIFAYKAFKYHSLPEFVDLEMAYRGYVNHDIDAAIAAGGSH